MPAVVRRLRSVEVIEIDLLGPGLGDPAERNDGAHEGKRYWRRENPLAVAVLESRGAVAGHFSPLPGVAEGNPAADLRSCYPGRSEIFGP
jgi:hypothetical protein